MTTKPNHPGRNALIESLPPEQRQRFLDVASTASLEPGKVLSDVDQPIQFVYFPTTAVLSILSVMPNRVAVETSVVGYEGMSPIAAFHHADSAMMQVVAQVGGEALRMPQNAFHAALADAPAMRSRLHRFSQALLTFTAQSSACNRQHSIVERCARWLLTTHDRVTGDDFHLTHLFLSQMLGVRRSSVTIAAEVLRAAGAITYTRGRVRVVDRGILHRRACACYDIVRSAYDRLLADRDTSSPLSGIAMSDGDTSLATGGTQLDAAATPDVATPPPPDIALAEFSHRVREARSRTEALRSLGAGADDGTGVVDNAHVLRLAEELTVALEQLAVAEEEMRAQMEALVEMRHAMETQQQRARERLDGLPDAFLETDQDDTIIDMNRAAEVLVGRPRRYLLGKPIASLFPDTERRGLRDVITQLRLEGRPAHWSGTLIGALRARPEVDVAVAPSGRHDLPEATARESPLDRSRFYGARWLLRPARDSGRSLS
jgi:PAS domain S-box-containing protein